MRKYLLLFLLSLVVSNFSQTLTFCEGVTEKGVPIKEATTFNIPKQGGYFYFLVKLPYTINCEEVYFEIYSLEDYDPKNPGMEGDGEFYETTISLNTKTDWAWFYKQVTFYNTGYFRIYVKDCSDSILASNVVRINLKK
jgi:hypothetical protein